MLVTPDPFKGGKLQFRSKPQKSLKCQSRLVRMECKTFNDRDIPDECDGLTLLVGLAQGPDVLHTPHGQLKLRVIGRRPLLVTHDLVIVAPPGSRGLGRHPDMSNDHDTTNYSQITDDLDTDARASSSQYLVGIAHLVFFLMMSRTDRRLSSA